MVEKLERNKFSIVTNSLDKNPFKLILYPFFVKKYKKFFGSVPWILNISTLNSMNMKGIWNFVIKSLPLLIIISPSNSKSNTNKVVFLLKDGIKSFSLTVSIVSNLI